MKEKIRTLLGLATTVFILASCGGGGGSSNNQPTEETRTGVFTDDPVAGVCYRTSSGITGQTDENGEFRYNPGDVVTFYIADNCQKPSKEVVIGDAPGQSTVTPVDLVADNTTNPQEVKEKVELITAFLYSVSQKENGKWKVDTKKALQEAQTLKTNDLENVNNPNELANELVGTLSVNPDEIHQHLNSVLLKHAKETLNNMTGKELLLQTKDSSGKITDTDSCQIKDVKETSSGINVTLNCKNNGELSFNIYADKGLLYVSGTGLEQDELVTDVEKDGICSTGHCLLVADQFSKDLYTETIAVLKHLNGKRIAFFDPKNYGDTCTLIVNSNNPQQFKLVYCDNPENNDDSWEKLTLQDGKVLAVDKEGGKAQILNIDIKQNKVFYVYKDEEDGNVYAGYFQPIKAPSIYNEALNVLEKLSGKTVLFNENGEQETCKLNVSEIKIGKEKLVQLKLSDCSDPDMNEVGYLVYSLDKALFIDKDGEEITYITEVNPDKLTISYTYTDDDGNTVTGYMMPGSGTTGQQQNQQSQNQQSSAQTLYKETIEVLKELNGKRVAFQDKESNGSTCTLIVNQSNPSQFKFVDCDDPDNNDTDWENLSIKDGKVVAVDEDGEESIITKVDKEKKYIYYMYENENGEIIHGYLKPVSSSQTSNQNSTQQNTGTSRSVSIADVFEGNFDTVYNALKDKQNKTDEEKLLFALSLLGKKIDQDVLSQIGSRIVKGDGEVFKVTDPDKQKVDSLSYQDYTKMAEDVVSDIQESINELQKINGQLSIKVPSFVYGEKTIYVDEPTVKTLIGLLYLKKALLEYALGYDASQLLQMENLDDMPLLEALVNISLKSQSNTFQNAKDDVKKGLENIKEALQEVKQMDQTTLEKSAVSLLLVDDEGELPTKDDINSAINYLDKAIQSLNGKVSLTTSDGKTVTLNLGQLFTNPLDPATIKQDVDSGKTVDVNACLADICYYNDETNSEECYCIDDEEEILFTSDSYLYNYINGISPELAQKLKERNLNNTVYYTVSEHPEAFDITILYPKQ